MPGGRPIAFGGHTVPQNPTVNDHQPTVDYARPWQETPSTTGYRVLIATMLVKDTEEAVNVGLARFTEALRGATLDGSPFVLEEWEHDLIEAMAVRRGFYSEWEKPEVTEALRVAKVVLDHAVRRRAAKEAERDA